MGKYAACVKQLQELINSDSDLAPILRSFYKKPREKISVAKFLEVLIDVIRHPEAKRYLVYALKILQESKNAKSIETNIEALISKRPKLLILKFMPRETSTK